MTKKEIEISEEDRKRLNKFDILTHLRMNNIYKANPELLKYIAKFLNTEKGIRPVALQRRFPKILGTFVWYPRIDSSLMLNMGMINTNFLTTNYGQIHFYETFFDEKILDEKLIRNEIVSLGEELEIDITTKKGLSYVRSSVYNAHIIGMSVCFDIDSPKDEFDHKLNCFDIWDKFMTVKYIIEYLLKKHGLDFTCVFSGNGIYVIAEELYTDDYGDYIELLQKIDRTIDYINYLVDEYYGEELHPKIDVKLKSWWNYDKVPFTYHTKWQTITIPLPRGGVDKEYVKMVSSIDAFEKNNVKYTKEIIETSVVDNSW